MYCKQICGGPDGTKESTFSVTDHNVKGPYLEQKGDEKYPRIRIRGIFRQSTFRN